MLDRRTFVTGVATLAIPRPVRGESGAVLRPEQFGARGDGVTNDGPAFAALSQEVNRRGGGTIVLGGHRTYLVGGQTPRARGWEAHPLMELRDLETALQIIGNGARLRCRPGLRYGTFDPATGIPVHRPMPNLNLSEVATPYRVMIHVSNCRGSIAIRDLELDGNVGGLKIGGQYGDSGWQIPASGLLLEGNLAEEVVENVYSHHHGQDGAMVIGDPSRTGRSRFSKLVCRNNGRQGLSLTGGRGYDFADCEFSRTGRSAIESAPGAGVDIEAEGKPIRDVSFARCKFVDNVGVGMVADSGDSEGARFVDCLFVGTTTWSAWPLKPRFSFEGCTFVGSVVHAFPDPDPRRAARFVRCRFTDDSKLSPTGKVYTGGGPIVNLAVSDNVLFDRCKFDLVATGVLPWSWRATYRDCTMRQRSKSTAMPKGQYLGRTTIDAPVDLYGTKVVGTLVLNGKVLPKQLMGGKPW